MGRLDEQIGSLIASFREQRGESQAALAAALGVLVQ